jgi:type IX secretion system PorP/SprF family membrane protein
MKYRFIILFFLFSTIANAQQDVHFSQFFNAPILYNPAQAGLNGDLRAIANYRNQWGSISTPYVTMNGSFDMPVLKKSNGKFGIGLNFYNDKSGESNFSQTAYNASLAYHFSLAKAQKNYFSVGFKGGIEQRAINTSTLYWDNQWTGGEFNTALPSYEDGTASATMAFDMSTGINWLYIPNNYTLYSAGLSINHITSPQLSFGPYSQKLYKKIIFISEAEFGSKTSNGSFLANVIYMKQGPNGHLNFGGALKYKLQEASHFTDFRNEAYFSIGAYMRVGDAVYPVAQFQYSGMKVGISYDFNVSKLSKATNGMGGFEIMLGYVANFTKSKTRQARFK